MAKKKSSDKSNTKKIKVIDTVVFKNKKSELDELYSNLNKIQEAMAGNFISMAKALNLSDIKVGKKQEYDDNNYFNQNFLASFLDNKDMELDSYDIEEGIPAIIEFISELKIPNSLDYMETNMSIEEYIARNPDALAELEGSFDYSHDVMDIAKSCFKNGITVAELELVRSFLTELLQAPEQAVPGQWE